MSSCFLDCAWAAGHVLNPASAPAFLTSMKHEHSLEWPRWATFALVAVVVTAALTIAAAINDIW
jgi:hypothetical protein